MLTFAMPWAFAILPLPLLIWGIAPPLRTRALALRVPFFRPILQNTGTQAHDGAVVQRRGAFSMILATVVWILLVLSMARPEFLGPPQTIEKAARDVMLAIDISGSMDDKDFQTEDGSRQQRLAAVKSVVSEFIAERDGDRVGLIVFGTKPFVQAPFTEDLQTVTAFLEQTSVGMAGPHTAIGDAIGLAIRNFETSEIEQRLLILLSDGADTGSRMSPINAAEIAAQNGVTIYTIGVGDPAASGEDRVDLKALEDIAARTGGQSFFAGEEAALKAIYDQIDEQTPRTVDTITHQPRRSLAYLPMALAGVMMGLFLLWRVAGHRKTGAQA